MEFILKSFYLFLISDNLPSKGCLQPLPIFCECILLDLNIAREQSKKWDYFEMTVPPIYFDFRYEILVQTQ